MTMNPYKTLGVDASATDADIKKAFRKLAVQHHPDRGGDESKFKEINTAYDIIKTAEKRQKYEMSSRHGNSFNFSTGGNPADMQDMFAQFFGGSPFQRRSANRNIQISIQATLEDVYHGNKKQIHVDQINKDLEITIPKGIGNGQSIRYKGLGMSTVPTATPGDLLCKVYVNPHRIFVREGLNLITEKSISCFDAINGTSVQMPTIDGKTLTVKVPAGTQPGLVMKLPEYGLVNQANRVGDCFLKINVSIPKNLTKEDRDDINRIAKKYP